MNRRLRILLLAACLAAPALADVVHLKSGGKIEGEVVRADGGVIVKLPAGEVRISDAAIARIEKKPSVLEEFKKRAAALKANDAAGHFALAQWAAKRRMKDEAQVLFQQVIVLDPNHAGARAALGHRLVNGQWVTEEQQMQARGLIRHDGQWMTPEAAAKLRTLKAELEVARERRRAAEAELQRVQQEFAQPRAEPPMGWNPYDRYYQNRDADLYQQRYSRYGYYGTYYHTPYSYYPAYRPYYAPGISLRFGSYSRRGYSRRR